VGSVTHDTWKSAIDATWTHDEMVFTGYPSADNMTRLLSVTRAARHALCEAARAALSVHMRRRLHA
jgi:hypothetical protein